MPGSCAFDLAHYVELLDAARAGGYRFAFFDHEPRAGDVLLRHDVDMSLAAAVTMAELEAEREVRATYFLMTRSDFYNLDSRSGVAALARLRELGHRIGLHGVYPDAKRDERFDPVVAWHTPDLDYMSVRIPGVVNVMQEGFFDPARYRSDSNQHWRSGCPHEELAAGASTGCSCSSIPRSGSTRARRCARRCPRSSPPSASCAGSSSPRIEST